MREDPIILEDWKPGYPSGSFYFPYNLTDYFATIGIIGALIVLSIINRNLSVLYLNLLILLLYTIAVLLTNENQRSPGIRVLEITFVVIWVFLMPFWQTNPIVPWLIGTLLYVKLVTTSILLQLQGLRDEIFIPKTNLVQERLENALLNLEVTEYNVDLLEILKSKNAIAREILPAGMIIYVVVSGVYLVSRYLLNDWTPVIQFIFLFFDMSVVIILAGFLFLWARQTRGKKDNEREIRKRRVSQPENTG